jgi:hypothetical protein
MDPDQSIQRLAEELPLFTSYNRFKSTLISSAYKLGMRACELERKVVSASRELAPSAGSLSGSCAVVIMSGDLPRRQPRTMRSGWIEERLRRLAGRLVVGGARAGSLRVVITAPKPPLRIDPILDAIVEAMISVGAISGRCSIRQLEVTSSVGQPEICVEWIVDVCH